MYYLSRLFQIIIIPTIEITTYSAHFPAFQNTVIKKGDP